ncbi:hypothetical protein ACKFKG_31645 [Phormidesmis sp. 146-35]
MKFLLTIGIQRFCGVRSISSTLSRNFARFRLLFQYEEFLSELTGVPSTPNIGSLSGTIRSRFIPVVRVAM